MTKYFQSFIACLLLTSFFFGQSVNEKDSMLIMATAKSVFNVFESPVLSEFEKLAAEKIHCIVCFEKADFPAFPYMVKRKRFYDRYLKEIAQSANFKKAAKATDISLIRQSDSDEVIAWFLIYEKNELAPGHEGAQLGMSFKKVNNRYLFAGIETIP